MGERTNLVDEGVERVQSAFQSMEDDFKKFQKQLDDRRAEITKRAEKRFKKLQKDLRKNKVYKRAESLRDDVNKQIEKQSKRIEKTVEDGLGTVLGAFQIASRSDLKKIDKKLNKIGRKLNALDKALGENPKPTPSKPSTAVAE